PGRGRHDRGRLAQLAVAVRLVDPPPGLVRPAWMGDGALRGALGRAVRGGDGAAGSTRPRLRSRRRPTGTRGRLATARRRRRPEPEGPRDQPGRLERRLRGPRGADGGDRARYRRDPGLGRGPEADGTARRCGGLAGDLGGGAGL